MSCTIVVGAQYGAEGKGKVAALLALREASLLAVRCGGPNSGHTITAAGEPLALRQLPAGVVNPNALLLVSAGCAVDAPLLIAEAERLGVERDRIVVDPRAVLVIQADRDREQMRIGLIGSTASGTGAALARRMARETAGGLVGGHGGLHERVRVEAVAPLVHRHLDADGAVIVEGTQGFGLSLLHGPHYPFATSRDTTAAGFAMEVGLAPHDVDHVVMVVRTFPIRVGGNSGPLHDEISWEAIAMRSGAPVEYEYTSVTKRLRRVGEFNLRMVKQACRYNRPTAIALMGLDRLDYRLRGTQTMEDLTHRAAAFVDDLQTTLGVSTEWLGTGFGMHDVVRGPWSPAT